MMKDKYTVLDASSDIWDIETETEQVKTLIRTINDTFFEDDFVKETIMKSGLSQYMEDARNLTVVTMLMISDIHDKLDAMMERITMNLDTEIGEVSV